MSFTHPCFFGYGSLVNKNTHSYDVAFPATLRGWRRAWRFAEGRTACFLTVEPEENSEIDGLIAEISGSWSELDAREAAYEKHDCTAQVTHDTAHPTSKVVVYAVPNPKPIGPPGARPILLSYLDAVAQGFLNVHGSEALSRFVDTTVGWDLPVLDDRSAPIYPRSQILTASERRQVDEMLVSTGSKILTPSQGAAWMRSEF